MTPRERLVAALDAATAADAEALCDRLAGSVGMLKVGSQLFTAAGPDFVRLLVRRGERVFLDLKYHDIPNTVAHAVAAASELGASLVTVHGLGGAEMLEAAARSRSGHTRLLAITVLTSHTEASLSDVGMARPLTEQVRRLALLAQQSGVDGVVASPHEVALVRSVCGPGFLVVTPGIRPAGAALEDQARAATPSAALAAGADYLVVGRPITGAPDPRTAALAIVTEMEGAASPSR